MTTSELELILRGGRVIDPAQGIDGVMDVGILGGRVAAVAPALAPAPRTKMINVHGKLVLPGLIDTHAHIYEHVTGIFGLNADLVGIRSGVTTVVDQGGASPLTFNGFRNFVAQPAKSRVLSFISIYLAGGLMGHSHAGLYGPHGIDVGATVRAIEENRDLVKGIKTHAEIGGYSRWGIEVLKLAKEASRRARVPVYVHLGGMWPVVKESEPDLDSILNQVLPLLDKGDVLAHPFTRRPDRRRPGRQFPHREGADRSRGRHHAVHARRRSARLCGQARQGRPGRRRPGPEGPLPGQRRAAYRNLQSPPGDERAARPGRSARRSRQHGDVECRRAARARRPDRDAGARRRRGRLGRPHRAW